jgi:hypothetical protein
MKPYGYVRKDGEGLFIYGEHQFQNAMGAELVPVYLHPKEWAGLTDEEILDCNLDEEGWMIDREVAKQNVETKLKEKNT